MSALDADGRSPLEKEAIELDIRRRYDALHEQLKAAARESTGKPDPKIEGCQCKTPMPTEQGDKWICATCGEPLRTAECWHCPDCEEQFSTSEITVTEGSNQPACPECGHEVGTDVQVYRRIRGDLDTPEQEAGRKVLQQAADAKAEMLKIISRLPQSQQAKLLKLRGPKFHRIAKRMIERHELLRAADRQEAVDPLAGMGPNQRRRLQRRSQELANVVDETIRRHAANDSTLVQAALDAGLLKPEQS